MGTARSRVHELRRVYAGVRKLQIGQCGVKLYLQLYIIL